MKPIKVLAFDEKGALWDLVHGALGFSEDIKLTGAAGSGADAIELAEELEPEVVFMDIELGGEPNAVEAGSRIRELRPATAMVMVCQYKDRELIAKLTAGPASRWSYLSKKKASDPGVLRLVIETVASGMVCIDEAVVDGPDPATKVGT